MKTPLSVLVITSHGAFDYVHSARAFRPSYASAAEGHPLHRKQQQQQQQNIKENQRKSKKSKKIKTIDIDTYLTVI